MWRKRRRTKRKRELERVICLFRKNKKRLRTPRKYGVAWLRLVRLIKFTSWQRKNLSVYLGLRLIIFKEWLMWWVLVVLYCQLFFIWRVKGIFLFFFSQKPSFLVRWISPERFNIYLKWLLAKTALPKSFLLLPGNLDGTEIFNKITKKFLESASHNNIPILRYIRYFIA